MKKTVRAGRLAVLLGVCVGLTSSSVHADYSITLQDQATGLTSADVPQGGTITLDLMLASEDPMDVHDGCALLISFDQAGLDFNSWDWNASSYTTGSPDDFTRMSPGGASGNALLGSLPAPLTSYGILFSANTRFGEIFGTGAVVSFELGVPSSFAVGEVVIDVGLDGLFSNWDVNFPYYIDGISTTPFTLNVTPEPATLMLLGLGGLAELCRFRSGPHRRREHRPRSCRCDR